MLVARTEYLGCVWCPWFPINYLHLLQLVCLHHRFLFNSMRFLLRLSYPDNWSSTDIPRHKYQTIRPFLSLCVCVCIECVYVLLYYNSRVLCLYIYSLRQNFYKWNKFRAVSIFSILIVFIYHFVCRFVFMYYINCYYQLLESMKHILNGTIILSSHIITSSCAKCHGYVQKPGYTRKYANNFPGKKIKWWYFQELLFYPIYFRNCFLQCVVILDPQ